MQPDDLRSSLRQLLVRDKGNSAYDGIFDQPPACLSDFLVLLLAMDEFVSKAAGKQFGRSPVLTAEAREAFIERLDFGTSIAEIAREFKTTRQTIMRARDAGLKRTL